MPNTTQLEEKLSKTTNPAEEKRLAEVLHQKLVAENKRADDKTGKEKRYTQEYAVRGADAKLTADAEEKKSILQKFREFLAKLALTQKRARRRKLFDEVLQENKVLAQLAAKPGRVKSDTDELQDLQFKLPKGLTLTFQVTEEELKVFKAIFAESLAETLGRPVETLTQKDLDTYIKTEELADGRQSHTLTLKPHQTNLAQIFADNLQRAVASQRIQSIAQNVLSKQGATTGIDVNKILQSLRAFAPGKPRATNEELAVTLITPNPTAVR